MDEYQKQVLFGIEEKSQEEKPPNIDKTFKKIKFWSLPLMKKLDIL